ncbi:MAG: flagellar basal body-associated FliL family protein [Gammaproteobacteria bacterium]|nr:flagellar basal body-associated FliL family protein [Gammaproteobacteria bacterium]
MAEKEDLDLDVKPASGNKKKIIIIALVGLLLVAAGIGGTLMLLGGGEKDESVAEGNEKVQVPKAHYLGLENMVVNFAQKGPVKHLQVEMQLMAHNPEVLTAVEEHMPVVRNDILVLLSSQNHEQLSSREGKELLRGELLAAVQRIVKENAGLDGPQAVYFTNFVMQ